MWNQEIREFEIHLEEGLYWMEEGDFSQALESFQRAIRIQGDHPEIYHYMGYIFVEEERFQDGLEAYSTALRIGKNQLSDLEDLAWWVDSNTRPYLKALKEIAQLNYKMGHYEEAIGHFCRLLNLNPQDNLRVIDWLMEAYFRNGQPENILEIYGDLEKIQDLSEEPSSQANLEIRKYQKAFARHWKDKEARKEFLDFLKKEQTSDQEDGSPGSAMTGLAYYNFGLAYFLLNQKKRAIEQWGRALQMNIYGAYALLEEDIPPSLPPESLEKWQAWDYEERFGDFWRGHPGALKALKTLWKKRP